MEVNVAIVSLRERHKQTPKHRVVLHVMPMRAHDADNLEVVRRTVAGRLRVANVLPDCVGVWKKFLRHFLIDDRHPRRLLVFRFRLREVAAAKQPHADGVEITGRGCGEKRARSRIGRFRIGRHRFSCGHDAARVCEIAVGQHRTEGGRLDAGKLSRPLRCREH